MSWSKATRLKTGTLGFFLVRGNVLDKKPNHWNCTGAMKKPYAMNRVRRSKSNGGGEVRAYPSSPIAGGFCLSKSLISIEMKSFSSCVRCCERNRNAVISWATVSATPPSTYNHPFVNNLSPFAMRYVPRGRERLTALVTMVVRTNKADTLVSGRTGGRMGRDAGDNGIPGFSA